MTWWSMGRGAVQTICLSGSDEVSHEIVYVRMSTDLVTKHMKSFYEGLALVKTLVPILAKKGARSVT